MPADRPSSRDEQSIEFLAILGLRPPVSVEDVKQAYLDKVKTAHPDRGGDPQAFIRLHEAFELATEYARFKAGRMKWLSGWVEQYAEQQAIIDEIKALGGDVEVDSVESLGQTIGSDFATVMDRLVGIRLSGPKITDAVIIELAPKLRRQAGLHRLELIDTAITDEGLIELRRSESLRHLDLTGTKVSAEVVEAMVAALDRLETLVVRGTGLGWASRLKLRFKNRDLEVIG